MTSWKNNLIKISEEELLSAICFIKKGKAPGGDLITDLIIVKNKE
jgi:hypothetical protein